ncbi:amidohydrolase family protein [Microbispora rosea]|uniref:amidohydrolase family protein n=1 Tax=Microbispora rosea TaxID=58117 RepID=UPI0004C35A8E|nr:amidohydrolase family protein [Microbispora rosea]
MCCDHEGEPGNRGLLQQDAEALRAYTIGSAYAAGEERHKGTLSRGKLADFVVLGDDLLAVAPERIKEVAVVATVVGGVFVFD